MGGSWKHSKPSCFFWGITNTFRGNDMEPIVNGTLKVTLVTAKGLHAVAGKEPTSVVRLRILNSDPKDSGLPPQISQVQTSLVNAETTANCNPVFNQDFKFTIKDTKNARLDATIWDQNVSLTEDKGFLGEVLVCVAVALSSSTCQCLFPPPDALSALFSPSLKICPLNDFTIHSHPLSLSKIRCCSTLVNSSTTREQAFSRPSPSVRYIDSACVSCDSFVMEEYS